MLKRIITASISTCTAVFEHLVTRVRVRAFPQRIANAIRQALTSTVGEENVQQIVVPVAVGIVRSRVSVVLPEKSIFFSSIIIIII